MGLGKPAPGQALGYLYQFERTLYWLSHPNVEMVSIETDDDVVSQLKDGHDFKFIYEQDKSVTGSNNPFGNTNVNLWKTLAIWTAIRRNRPDVRARFVLATNRKVSSSCLAVKIHKANMVSDYKTSDTLEPLCDELMEVDSKLKGKSREIRDQVGDALIPSSWV